MGQILAYREEAIRAMELLSADDRVLFVGQDIIYPGVSMIYETLKNVPLSKKIEMPVAEDMQLGMCTGLALAGYIPVSIYPRIDFLILATNQLVNHLDKIEEMSCGQFKPKVIIRTMVGSIKPLNPGAQHCQDHTEALECLVPNIDVVKLGIAEIIVPAYKAALESDKSSILIEMTELYY